MMIKKILLGALLAPFFVYAHQYTNLDDLVADVCTVHTFDKCTDPVLDSDGDGVTDDIDQCPGTPANTPVDAVGCAIPPPDADGDGIPDADDPCPNDPTNTCNPPSGHLLLDAPVNQWTQIPNSRLVDVLPPEAFQAPIKYVVGPAALATAWSGASWDNARNEMHFIAGGGHADYCGNQHLKFGLDNLAVTQVRPPSSLGNMTYTELGDAGATPDGHPNSRHTYGGTVYDSARDVHYLFPGSSCDPAGDSDRKVWEIRNDGTTQLLMDIDYPSLNPTGWRGSRNQAIHDPINNEIWVSNMGVFYKFDPLTGTRQTFQGNQPQFSFGFKQGSAFDKDRRTMLLSGGGSFWTYNVDTNSLIKHQDKGLEFKDCYGPGLTFSEKLDEYIAWCGGNDIYRINPVDYSVTIQTSLGEAPAIPATGMHGKMRYSDKYDGLIVNVSSEQNFYFLKP